MAYYRGIPKNDRAKAIVGVLLVHAALGAVIFSGLNVQTVRQAVERLKTFDITEALPPPPIQEPPPPPDESSSAPKDEAAPANIKSKPTPVVAPRPPIPLPIQQKINTAQVRGPEGLDRTAGASNVPGPGTGAGGQGSGFGGGGRGGTGTGDGRSPAVLVRNIPRNDYRQIGGDRLPYGAAGLALRIDAEGRVSDCRVARSSGDAVVDARVCQVALKRLRFRPARASDGRAIPYFVHYTATWSRNR